METSKFFYLLCVSAILIMFAGCGGISLSGVVQNSSTGQPIEGVAIKAEAKTAGTSLPTVFTDDNGKFRIKDIEENEAYQLTFQKETVESRQEEYLLDEIGKKRAEKLEIQLNEFSVIRGKVFGVTEDRKEPLSGALVELLEETQAGWENVSQLKTETDPSGIFTLSGITKPGNYRLNIYHTAYRATDYPQKTSYHLKRGQVWRVPDRHIVLEASGISTTGDIGGEGDSEKETGGRVIGTPTKNNEN
jgi:5-hydroxyisourate hydrolase-like protein (transthyretin family)